MLSRLKQDFADEDAFTDWLGLWLQSSFCAAI